MPTPTTALPAAPAISAAAMTSPPSAIASATGTSAASTTVAALSAMRACHCGIAIEVGFVLRFVRKISAAFDHK
jgi:hypothetical protein